VVAPQKRDASYADIEALPPGVTGQLLGGELYAHARPAGPHLRAASRLGATLLTRFDQGVGGPGGWLILDEPELHLGADVLVPDIAAWRRERLPSVPDAPFITQAPAWVCEVLSPGTTRVDRMLKLPIYAREGVAHVWLVDPLEQAIEVFRLAGGQWVLAAVAGEGEPVALEPFEALPLELAYLWSG